MTITTLPDRADQDNEVVLGVDTHCDVHVAAILTALGTVLATLEFPTTAAGYREMHAWALSFGVLRRAGVECTGSYGAALSRYLQAAEIAVIEVNHTDRADRRRRGKTDTFDAENAARSVISGRATTVAKTADGHVEAIRVMRTARNSAVNAHVKAVNQLRAIIVGADPALRDSLSGLGPATLIRRCSTLPEPAAGAGPAAEAVVYTLRVLGARIIALKAEAYQLLIRIRDLVALQAPGLLEQNGVGPDSAAALLIAAGGNPHRIRDDASFAALCGSSPVEASSGLTSRRRLNRGGDRQANAALYRIVLSRLRWHDETITYMNRRLAEGKTKREIIRCLKRYVARQVFSIITKPPTVNAASDPVNDLLLAA